MRLIEVLRAAGPKRLDVARLVALVQILRESDGGYTPMMKKGRAEYKRADQAAARYGTEVVRLLQRHARDDWEYLARCKRAAILADWVAGVPAESIEREFTTNPYQGVVGLGDVVKFADATRFHLRSAHQIAALLFIDDAPSADGIDAMLKRLQLGVPEDVLALVGSTITFTRGELLTLRSAGATTVEAIWRLPLSTLEALVGQKRAKELIASKPVGRSCGVRRRCRRHLAQSLGESALVRRRPAR